MIRRGYPTDLTNSEWDLIEGLFKVSYTKGGRPPSHSKREIVNAIFYILRTGCQWRYLPNDFPPWKTVYSCIRNWKAEGLFEKMNFLLTKHTRMKIGRNENPMAAMADSQYVKTTEKGALKVTNGAKKVKGSKRHILRVLYWAATSELQTRMIEMVSS